MHNDARLTDSELDAPINFCEAAAFVTTTFPGRRGGRRLHASTIYRWALNGIRGQRLRFWQVGGSRFTSRKAIYDFFEAASCPSGPTMPNGQAAESPELSSPTPRSPNSGGSGPAVGSIERRHAAAERKLSEAGI
jgi:Protein of unknown function (DUF1580)